MADNNENILVEFDYNNISIIDPNKVVDSDGKVKERYIKQEDLVIYANLECTVKPRTKLAIGGASNDNSRLVRLASINFLNPGKKQFLDNNYTDELTGKNTLNGLGVNQYKKNAVRNPNNSDDYYITQQAISEGKFGSVDNGMLGITNITIKQNSSFLTQINVTLEDIKGRTLFESGDESPYAAFFNLPYPLFYLTIKGYIGKAVRLALMLTKFDGRYDTSSGNFKIQLNFMTYKYTILSEISMGALMAVPHMYKNKLTTPKTTGGLSTTENQEITIERGYQKIKELYSEYKNKGLIPDNFPEFTLVELKDRIEVFLKTVLDNFSKQDMTPLTDVRTYLKQLEDYRGNVFYYKPSSWFYRNMDTINFFVINKGGKKYKIYTFKEELKAKQGELVTELKKIIADNNKLLNDNPTLGTNGQYSIQNGPPKKTSIPNSIILDDFFAKFEISDVDKKETLKQRNRGGVVSEEAVNKLTNTLDTSDIFKSSKLTLVNGEQTVVFPYYIFEGDGSFIDKTDKMTKDCKKFKEQIENDLTESLANILKSPTNGIGFNPTIRNILAVIFANGEAFLRLLDDVHTAADALRYDDTRQRVISDPEVLNVSTNTPDGKVDEETPIYPWPQFINITNVDGKEKYEIKYPGSDELKEKTQAYNFDVWPEVEFVEEFIKGYVQRETPPANKTPINDSETEPLRVTYNSIEFPVKNNLFSNKEQTKFFYEIYERILLNTFYSRLSRCNVNNSSTALVTDAVGECESENIILGLGNDSPFLIQTLKNFGINSSNILNVLFQFSNNGLGESWNNYQNGIFNTRYIRNYIDNAQFQFLNIDLFDVSNSQPQISLTKEKNIKEYVEGTTSNVLDVTDTYPFTNLEWCKTYLANGSTITDVKQNMNTQGTLTYNGTYKIITNFTDVKDVITLRPVTYFLNKLNQQQPLPTNLKLFYESREYRSQLVTEGNVFYRNYSGNVTPNQTTSIFNTPYFVNAIQDGVEKYRNNSPYPYVSAAYLFLNSLPLGTLKEKLKSFENGSTVDKTYLYASLKKFGAVHKLPYSWILKYGSIWHRYKTYVESGFETDILTPIWKNFDAVKNYDPVTNSINKTYELTINNENYPIVFQTGNTLANGNFTKMDLGFYPKTINDFSIFYLGGNIIKEESQIFGVGSINGNTLTVTQINGDLVQGNTILGNNIFPNTLIVSAITSNTFEIFPPQQAIADFFYVTNAVNAGYTDSDIQEAILSGLTFIPIPFNFNLETSFYTITNWSSYIKTQNNNFGYLMPSFGTGIIQYFDECVNGTTLRLQITGNTAVYNGSVRTYWTAPNYGYFDNESVVKPTPFQYMKNIDSSGDDESMQNYSINGISSIYSDIDEIFSVFDKKTLDIFEKEFLNFSRSVYDIDDENVDNTTQVSISNLRNFQALMRQAMLVPLRNGLMSELQEDQFKTLNNILSNFLDYNVIVKIGNPANFDRRLFYTFSNIPFENPYTWREYNIYTPSALPSANGTINFTTSYNLYPLAWQALYTYVGFSVIDLLDYKDSGSFITDFFIDFNMEFTIDNVKTFAPIIKIYATQKLNKFQSNPLPPDPLTNNTIRLLVVYTLSDSNTVSIYETSINKALYYRSSTGIFLISPQNYDKSKTNEDILNEFLLSLYPEPLVQPTVVSIDEIPVPEFEFTPSPLNPAGRDTLNDNITLFLEQSENYSSKIVDNVFNTLRNKLKNTTTAVPENTGISNLEGPQTKDELWEVFKAINDKWIAGADISSRTLFEDILILDRANRNIGDKFLIDIFGFKNRLANIPEKSNMLLYVQSILRENNFQVMNIPSYVNFYNVQDVVKDPIPKPEGALEIGNTLFGVFNNVDYSNSSTKMVCQYAGKPSEHLAIKNIDYRYRNDSFELNRVSDNPLIENQIGKNDWDKSNKVVGFNVDIGPQNQSIIKSFQVSQNGGLPTMESLKVLNDMANQAGNRSNSTQSVSLFNLYKNRSYTCNLSMMGNAMIQPTMYFNLRYVPMFSGPYLITEVNHTIGIGDFSTDVTGVRQPTASLPTVDNFLQSLKQNLLKKIDEKIKLEKEGKQKDEDGNVIEQKDEVIETTLGDVTLPRNQVCKVNVVKYNKYANITPTKNKQSFINVKLQISNQINVIGIGDGTDNLNKAIFVAMYLGSGYESGFQAYEHNYSGIKLTEDWQSLSTYLREQYFCLSVNKKENPYAVFSNLTNHIIILINKWKDKVRTDINSGDFVNSLTKFLILNRGYYTTQPSNVYSSMPEADIKNISEKVKKGIDIFNAS